MTRNKSRKPSAPRLLGGTATGLALLASAVAGGTLGRPANATAEPNEPGDGPAAAGASECVQMPISADRWVTADGSSAKPEDPSAINEVSYKSPEGAVWTQIIPSDNFNPLTASAATLKALGMPERPQEEAKLKTWSEAVSKMKSVGEGLCTIPGSGQFGVPDPNWAGHYTNHHAQVVTEVAGKWKSPSYVSYCPHQSDDGTWVGIGGLGGVKNLIQAGFSNWSGMYNHSGLIDTVVGFMEKLPEGPVWPLSGLVGHHGDHLNAYVAYLDENRTYFHMENETTGSYGTYSRAIPASFIDNSTGEWIDEAPDGYMLRKSTSNTDWTLLEENYGAPTGALTEIDLQRTHLMMSSSYDSSAHQQENVWHNCD